MSEEELKAVEELKEQKEKVEDYINAMECTPEDYYEDFYNDCLEWKKYAETLLNLIEKQDKLIDLIVQDISSDVCNSKKCSQYENCKECKLDKYRKRVETND